MEVRISTFRLLHLLQRLLHLLQRLLHLLQRLLHLACSTPKVCWCGRLGQVPQQARTGLLYKFYWNQALLSGATAAAGRCAGSLSLQKM